MTPIVRTLSFSFGSGHRIEPHDHDWGQLVYASAGAMRVSAEGTMWIVPPARAIWAPPGVRHAIEPRGEVKMRTLYLDPDRASQLPAECRAIEVSPLLRELVLKVAGMGMLRSEVQHHRALADIVVEELRQAEALPLSLKLPRDSRARRAAERMLDRPDDQATVERLGREAGASVRTLQRLFLEETGLRLAEWRQRLRLLQGAATLGSGGSVTEAGLDAGYGSTSAFIAAFRRQFGRTPARLRDQRQ